MGHWLPRKEKVKRSPGIGPKEYTRHRMSSDTNKVPVMISPPPHMIALLCTVVTNRAFPVAQMAKNLPAVQETHVPSLGWEDPLEKGMVTTPVFLPGEFHGKRSLVYYSP